MSAVSQSYPNYLGGLNEQPDELKKPGQLVQATNVIPDPTIGLSRRPGFELINQSIVDPVELPYSVNPDPEGTWFEIELSNQVNEDYIYFGNVTQDGKIVIFNQDGVKQAVRYTENNKAITPHLRYEYNSNQLKVIDDKLDTVETVDLSPVTSNGYFRHESYQPLKYCVSKSHAIITNPKEVPTLTKGKKASEQDKRKYYSFVSIKLLDTTNYNYVFKVFGPKGQVRNGRNTIIEYDYIDDVEAVKISDELLDDYDTDTTLPLQVRSPFSFELGQVGQDGIEEVAEVEVNFVGQVVQLKSGEGDGYRNEVRYTWSTSIVTAGKGYKEGQIFKITKDAAELGGPSDLEFTFEVQKTKQVREVENDTIKPDNIENLDASQLIDALRQIFEDNQYIDRAIVVGNGIYLESNSEFSVSTTETAIADIMNSQKLEDDEVPIVRINTTAELPVECLSGFIVQVSNSFDGQRDYYLEYVAESEVIIDGEITKSDGYWEEVAKPYEAVSIRNGTMPHMITIARESDQLRFVFVVSPIRFVPRTAGTKRDNPSMFADDSRITTVTYYKNRLFFFTSNGTVISSQAGNIDNMFLNTALNTSPIDPLDIVANNSQKVPIHGVSVVNNGMVLFGDSEQYMLTTNGDLLTSETANITKVSNYTFDYRSNPIYLGANLGFISSGMSRFYEMTNLYDRGPVDINERSQQIQSSFGQGFNMPVSSREQSMVLVYKSEAQSPNLRLYRFRQEIAKNLVKPHGSDGKLIGQWLMQVFLETKYIYFLKMLY